MVRNAVIAMISFFICFWVLGALLGEAVLILGPVLLVGLIAGCTTLILQEIDSLRREIRGEAPEELPPLTERLSSGDSREEQA